jgi:hypothetical protein
MGADYPQEDIKEPQSSVEPYRKWFDLNHMDFSIECRDNKYSCSAWFRGKWGGAQGFSYADIIKAVHSCYVEAKKELSNPTPRKRDWSPS